jgi:hypothetical protein
MEERLQAIESKLDALITLMHAHDKAMDVHLAVDEAWWQRVTNNEAEIKELVKSNGKVKAKLAVITATIAGAAANLPTLIRAFL